MNSITRRLNSGVRSGYLGLSALAVVLLALSSPAAVVIDWATVGNANNPADPTTGYGSVGYTYKIGKFEVTIGQYTEFLNNAAKSDPYGLYNPQMGSIVSIAGISRSIDGSGNFLYSTIGSASRPITYVNWFDSARFCNWMHNGQGAGSTETGVYNLNGATSGIFIAQPGASVWIPTENEWYKAAYYDPTPGAGGGDNYWLYPTQSETLGGNTIGVPNSANYNDGNYAKDQNGLPTFLTEVGAYGSNSDSYYGTFDQGGSLVERNDAVISSSSRGLRGGAWYNLSTALCSWNRSSISLSYEGADVGFRLAGVPEPCAMVLMVLSGFVAFARRKR